MSETSETLHVIRKKLYSFSSEPNVWYTIGIIRVYVDDYHEIFYSVSLFNKINYLDFIEYFTIITYYPLIIPIITHNNPDNISIQIGVRNIRNNIQSGKNYIYFLLSSMLGV